jgi:hypothetical protein
MNTLARALPRSRTARGLLAHVSAVTLTAGTMTVMGDAHAETDRRICAYSFKALPKNTNPNNPRLDNPLVQVSIGMNYKKDGACPSIKKEKLAATGYVDFDQVNPKKKVNKWTCEDWGATHQTYLGSIGSDPCYVMWQDTMYAFIWQDPTTPNAPAPRYVQLDEYWDYQ